ncbi:tetratricopeptide repeat protein [Suttonella sp. R2A3]|uniref:tetratricopeptide repeat protein n=1 Tax=Suttonella sp. R2A3 TaxID=2908648 RepID=UPI001F25469A|nr:tetratricopeptide repeat protein [Suttonella sp. R2A3]UJF23803.1 tetratricopeptide repeat protein [Suttonella sp. R2A3]
MKKPNRFIASVLVVLLGGCSSLDTTSTGGIKPDYEKAYQDYLALGAQYLQMGRYDLAEPKLKRAIEINSQPAEAWNVLAVLYEEKRDIASGYQAYQKLISSHPDYTLGFVNFATFLCKFNRDPERQALYQQMRGKGAEFQTLSYIMQGNCERSRGNITGAEGAYRQALTLDSQAPGALLPLAEIALQRGNATAALNYLRIVHTYVGYSAESAYLGIQAARQVGDVRMEEDLLRVMRASYTQSPQAQQLGL